MRLDASFVRYLESDEVRVLTAVEVGSRNHEIVPTQLIASISRMRPGGVHKVLSNLGKHGLIGYENGSAYEGYRLTYGGYDYLALHTFSNRGSLAQVGRQIGTGKESDIYLGETGVMTQVDEDNGNDNDADYTNDHKGIKREKNGRRNGGRKSSSHHKASRIVEQTHVAPGELVVLKIQRLGRTSFRTVRTNRDYAGKGRAVRGASWMYLSRLAAQKEWAFMKALYERGFPVPKPIDQNRHCVIMQYIDGDLLDNVHLEDLIDFPDTDADTMDGEEEGEPNLEQAIGHNVDHTAQQEAQKSAGDQNLAIVAELYDTLISLILRFAENGLIHGDFNEFNLLRERQTGRIVVIDFPQMVSTSHPNAQEYFDRDVQCICSFMKKRFGFVPNSWPEFKRHVVLQKDNLDKMVKASGFTNWGEEVSSEFDESEADESEDDESNDDKSEDDGDRRDINDTGDKDANEFGELRSDNVNNQ